MITGVSWYCKCAYFRLGNILRQCWQDLSHGGDLHDITLIALWDLFLWGGEQWLGRDFCQMGHFQLFSMILKFSMGHFISFINGTMAHGPLPSQSLGEIFAKKAISQNTQKLFPCKNFHVYSIYSYLNLCNIICSTEHTEFIFGMYDLCSQSFSRGNMSCCEYDRVKGQNCLTTHPFDWCLCKGKKN